MPLPKKVKKFALPLNKCAVLRKTTRRISRQYIQLHQPTHTVLLTLFAQIIKGGPLITRLRTLLIPNI